MRRRSFNVRTPKDNLLLCWTVNVATSSFKTSIQYQDKSSSISGLRRGEGGSMPNDHTVILIQGNSEF